MFETLGFPKGLDESVFQKWLDKGRNSPLSVNYLIVKWNEMEEEFEPQYLEHKEQIKELSSEQKNYTNEKIVAVYDIYSESRINIINPV